MTWIFTACKNPLRNWFLHVKNSAVWNPVCRIWVFQLDFWKFKYRSTGGKNCFHKSLHERISRSKKIKLHPLAPWNFLMKAEGFLKWQIVKKNKDFLTVNIFAVYVLVGFFYELAFCENIVTLRCFFSGSAIFSLYKQARFLQFRNLYIYLALPIWPSGAYILHSILDIFRLMIVHGHPFICSKVIWVFFEQKKYSTTFWL